MAEDRKSPSTVRRKVAVPREKVQEICDDFSLFGFRYQVDEIKQNPRRLEEYNPLPFPPNGLKFTDRSSD